MGGGRGLLRRLRQLGRDYGYERYRSRSRWMACRVILGCDFRNSCIPCPRVEALVTGLGWAGEMNRNTSYVVRMRR